VPSTWVDVALSFFFSLISKSFDNKDQVCSYAIFEMSVISTEYTLYLEMSRILYGYGLDIT